MDQAARVGRVQRCADEVVRGGVAQVDDRVGHDAAHVDQPRSLSLGRDRRYVGGGRRGCHQQHDRSGTTTRAVSYATRRPARTKRTLGKSGLRLGEVAGDGRVDRDARAGGRRDDDLLEVAALRGRRLGPQDLVERGAVVLGQLGFSSNDALPITKCRLACLSTRKLILPPLMSETAFATSGVTVPVFGFGIRPRGPSTRAMRPTLAIWSGVAIAASKSRKPPWIFSIRSSLPTSSAPAASGRLGLVADREHDDAGGLAGAVRQVDGAADHLVGLAGVDAEPDGDLDGRVLLLRRRLLGQLGGLERGVELVAVHLLGGFAVCLAVLAHWIPIGLLGCGWSGRSGPSHWSGRCPTRPRLRVWSMQATRP